MSQEIIFVSGKGGVGKSTLAAAIAYRKAQSGAKTLLVELGDHSYFKDFFGLSQVVYEPTQLKENLSLSLWTGQECLREYARHLLKVDSLTKLFFENAVSQSLINVAPGLCELAILGKITSGIRHIGPPMKFDCLVVDAFATGHFLSLLAAPRALAEAIRFGPMGEQSRGIDEVIRNKKICTTYLVSLPEELPVRETEELSEKLKNEFQILPDIFLNKVIQTNLSLNELKSEGEFGHYVSQILQRQKNYFERLTKVSSTVKELPLTTETDPWKLVEKLAEGIS